MSSSPAQHDAALPWPRPCSRPRWRPDSAPAPARAGERLGEVRAEQDDDPGGARRAERRRSTALLGAGFSPPVREDRVATELAEQEAELAEARVELAEARAASLGRTKGTGCRARSASCEGSWSRSTATASPTPGFRRPRRAPATSTYLERIRDYQSGVVRRRSATRRRGTTSTRSRHRSGAWRWPATRSRIARPRSRRHGRTFGARPTAGRAGTSGASSCGSWPARRVTSSRRCPHPLRARRGCRRARRRPAGQELPAPTGADGQRQLRRHGDRAARPQAVKDAIAAGNAITNMPYLYGGGHGSFEAAGYDCSGSVSYALHGGGFLSAPLDFDRVHDLGRVRAGQWITVYSNPGHAYAVIAGLRFDTSGAPPRWQGPLPRLGRVRRDAPAGLLSQPAPEAHVLACVADPGLERQPRALGDVGVARRLLDPLEACGGSRGAPRAASRPASPDRRRGRAAAARRRGSRRARRSGSARQRASSRDRLRSASRAAGAVRFPRVAPRGSPASARRAGSE